MTQAELDELKALANAATAGPWFCKHPRNRACHPSPSVIEAHGSYVLPAHSYSSNFGDGTFIAIARTAVPQLIAEVERLRAELDSWTEHADTERRACGVHRSEGSTEPG